MLRNTDAVGLGTFPSLGAVAVQNGRVCTRDLSDTEDVQAAGQLAFASWYMWDLRYHCKRFSEHEEDVGTYRVSGIDDARDWNIF